MMTFPEGFSGKRIQGAKKVRLLGADEPGEFPEIPAELEPYADEPSFGRNKPDAVPRGKYLAKPAAGGKRRVDAPDPVKVRNKLKTGKRPERRGGTALLSSTNIFGLASRSESLFPEAYRPILTRHWEQASDNEYNQIIRRQAMINKAVSFRETDFLPVALTAAEEAYEEAVGRRNQAIRRRSKPRNYEERKRFAEEQRKAPLTRRYVTRDPRLENTSFIKGSALETAVLVPGFAQVIKEVRSTAPAKLRRRPRKTAPANTEKPEPKPVPKLPTFDTANSKKVAARSYRNSFGLTSRSVTSYPEAYRGVSRVFWQGLTEAEREDIDRVQAAAMEKVGFEPKTQKQFIENFDPGQENRYGTETHNLLERQSRRPVNLPVGIMLILLGLIGLIPCLPYGEPVWLLILAIAGIAGGVVLGLPLLE